MARASPKEGMVGRIKCEMGVESSRCVCVVEGGTGRAELNGQRGDMRRRERRDRFDDRGGKREAGTEI